MFTKLFLCLSLSLTINQNAANKVAGLELSAPQEFNSGAKIAKVDAVCDGPVRWLVISDEKLKYEESDRSVIISLPNTGTINIFAVGLDQRTLTQFAATKITVKKNTSSKPKDENKLLDYKMRWR